MRLLMVFKFNYLVIVIIQLLKEKINYFLGFDDQGRLYDKDGIFFSDEELSLWTNETVEMYKTKAQCIVDQFDKYVDKQINKNLNGLLTQSENIADSGGLKQAFKV